MATVPSQPEATGAPEGGALLVLEEIGVHRRSERVSRRRERGRLHHVLRSRTSLRGVSGCGRALGGLVHVGVVDHGGDLIAHVQGIGRCGSPWACPSCAPVVREGRAGEIDRAMSVALALGYVVLFVTTTLPHEFGDRLERTFGLVRDGHRRTRSGRRWQQLRDAYGYVGSIRAWEVTHGANGWHPHGHELLIFERDDQRLEWDVRALYEQTYGRFIEQNTGKLLHRIHGIDVRRVSAAGDLAAYLTKVEGGWGAGLEVARSDLKRSAGRRTAWDLLTDACEGDVAALDLWHEYEQATHGRRAVQWSPGLRGRLLGLEEEPSDEDLAAAAPEGEEVWSVDLLAEEWAQLVRQGAVAAVLEECEARARAALQMSNRGSP